MAHKSPRYCLYREFVNAFMKGHPDMTRCVSIKTQNLHSDFFVFFSQDITS